MDIQTEKNQDRKGAKTRVRVAIRVRPMIPKQIANNENTCVQFKGKQEIILAKERNYKFDHVFRDNSPQAEVYQSCVKELVLGCFEGYNAAILAYGQTGSGKTFTMGTALTTIESDTNRGIIPRVIQQIFAQIKERQKQAEFIIKASFLEIYNQQILDLLSDSISKTSKNKEQLITIREQKDGSVSICNVTEEVVTSADQMIALLQRGGYHRTTATTLMNDASSRSHAIFTIFIEQHRIDDLYPKDSKTKDSQQNDDGFMTAKFFFVDLAGSQRAKKTGATGVTLKQGININLGLLELGNVISALSTIEKKQDQFITYRNSKLTRILQECLGGNSNTYMIACVSPAQSNFQQSLNTLKYASKAMNIKNKPIKNVDPHTAQISQLKQRIYELEVQNRKLKTLLNQKGVNVEEQIFQSSDVMTEERQKLKKMYVALQKKYEEAMNELKEEKKNKNILEISQYEVKRQRDVALLKIDMFKQKFPAQYAKFNQIDRELQVGTQKMSVLNQLSERIQLLANQLKDKDKINSELQRQFSELEANSKKDEKLLVAKNTTIYQLKRENEKLQKIITNLKSSIENSNMTSLNSSDFSHLDIKSKVNDNEDNQIEGGEIDLHAELDLSNLDLPPELLENERDFQVMASKAEQELSSVDRKILERQRDLESMHSNQIKLEYELISQMKEQYHQKIILLEKEKSNLMKMRDESVGTNEKNKFVNKIDNLENELKQYRKKAKEQKNLEKLVSNQSNKIKDLATEIKKFKVQKIELGKKLKEDKDNFQKFKAKKVKELFQAKKQNVKKQNQIKKLILDNTKQNQTFKKKEQQLHRAKRINETLKNLLKPSTQLHSNKKTETVHRKNSNTMDPNKSILILSTSGPIGQKYCQEHVQRCIKKILGQVDQERVLKKYENKVKQLSTQIEHLLSEQSSNKLKLQKLMMKVESQEVGLSQQQENEKRELELNIHDLKQRITNAEDNLSFCQNKYEEILKSNRQEIFDLDTEVIYQKVYQQMENLRTFLRVLFTVVKSLLSDNYELHEIKDNLELDLNTAHQNITEMKQQIQQMQAEHQQSLEQLREEMMVRYYSNIEEQEANVVNSNNIKRLEEKDRKNYERKIVDLTKTNRQVTHEVEMLRRKCIVVQEKYQNIRSLLSKDRGIGRQNKDADEMSNNKKGKNMLDEINQMTNKLDEMKVQKLKRVTSLVGTGEEMNLRNSQQFDKKSQQQFDYSSNKWECMGKIDAHNSAVLSIATHANMLISTSTKSLKIWDLETSKIISDLSGAHLTGLVKYVLVEPERNIMLTACEKVVTVWDLVTLNVECTLKAHKDEVRTMHIANDILFTGGKGLANSGSLLIWDLRNLDPNKPQEQKQRNQDIFTFASRNKTLYYGTRNHHVRRMDMESMEILAPFEPPHMDTVTGLAIVGDKMVSGSKDKNLRLWGLDHSVGNLKNTAHAFNEYVTTVQSQTVPENIPPTQPYLPIFYAGSKDGQIKVGSVKGEKIDFVGSILAHTQSVNAVSILEDNTTLVSASADKTIKLWKPTTETIQNLHREFS